MRSLFWKIFLWFWVAMATVVLTISAIVFVTQQQRFRERERMHGFGDGPPSRPEDRVIREALSVHFQTASFLLQQGGVPALRTYLQKLETSGKLRTYCFDAQGNDLLKLPATPGAFGDVNQSRLHEMAQNASHNKQFQTADDGPFLLAAQNANFSGSQAPPLVLAAAWNTRFEPPGSANGPGRDGPGRDGPGRGGPGFGPGGGPFRRPPFGGPFGFLWDLLFAEPSTPIQAVRLFVILMTTGLVCYGLVRHLTTPIFQLRAATKQLAAGDLSTRVDAGLGRRHDELGVLGRDFDQMAERLEALVAAQNRLIADISHELRSPLARVNVAVELVRAATGPEASDDLDRIALETERLNAMIGQLLTLSRLESGERLIESTPVDLAQLVAGVAADADFEASNRKRAVQVIKSANCLTCGNEALLRSAIENIVRNAVRYTEENTTVEIGLEQEEAFAVIRVRDHGPGVPEEALPHLFQPFYRIADARERTSGGTGLGLSIADRAVRFHGGTLEASNVPGEGNKPAGLLLEMRLPLMKSLEE